jgi:hypothetical protein
MFNPSSIQRATLGIAAITLLNAATQTMWHSRVIRRIAVSTSLAGLLVGSILSILGSVEVGLSFFHKKPVHPLVSNSIIDSFLLVTVSSVCLEALGLVI